MIYNVTDHFVQISETSGTIQNSSYIFDVEISHKAENDSGILLFPLNKVSFSNQALFARCIGGYAQIRVVPFILDGGGYFDNSSTSDDDFLNAAWNGDYTPDPQTDAVIDDMWNSNDLIDTGDGFDDVINSFLSP